MIHAATEVQPFRQRLWAGQFRPLPVRTNDKIPDGLAWQEGARQNPPLAVNLKPSPTALSTGILCDGLRVVDVDIEDRAISEQATSLALTMLGAAPIRYRSNSAKCALFYRAANGEPRKIKRSGNHGAIEILGKGQQVVVDGIHPSGAAYEWRDGVDLQDRAKLPEVTVEQIEAFLRACAEIIGVHESAPAPVVPLLIEKPSMQAQSRGEKAAAKALSEEANNLATMGQKTGRNDALNGIAYRMGRFITAGFIGRAVVEQSLQQACVMNGLWQEDGGNQCKATLASGIESGVRAGAVELQERKQVLPAHDPVTGEIMDLGSSTRLESSSELVESRGQVTFLSENVAYVHEPELIRDTLPLKGVAFIAGQSGAGKTFLALELAVCVMTGPPLAARAIEQQGGVLYCAFEGAGTIAGRMKARRSVLDNPDMELPFAIMEGFGVILKAADYLAFGVLLRSVAQQMQFRFGVPLRAVIIDTVSAAGMIEPDKENDPGAWTAIFDGLNPISKELQCLMLPIHHMGKSAEAGLRGSSNARAGADAVLAMTCARDEITGDTRDHNLALTKSRCAPEGSIAAVAFDKVEIGNRPDGSPVTSLVIKFDGSTIIRRVPKGRKVGRGVMTLKQALDASLQQFGVDQHVGGKTGAPRIRAVRYWNLRDAFDSIYVTGTDVGDPKRMDAVRKALARAIEVRNSVHDDVATGRWNDQDWVWLPKGWVDEN